LIGATSKLGRAIALYLFRKQVRVLILTSSTERFQVIQREAPVECQKNCVVMCLTYMILFGSIICDAFNGHILHYLKLPLE